MKMELKKLLDKKLIISFVLILIVIILSIFIKSKFFTKAQTVQNTARYTALAKTNLVTNISTSGNIKSKTSAGVTSSLDTAVKQINVKAGDQVKAGDVIAVMDTTDLENEIAKLQKSIDDSQQKSASELASKQAAYESAQSEAANQSVSNSNKSKNGSTGGTNQASSENLTKAKNDYESALADYNNSSSSSMEEQLAEKQAELTKAQITAPFDGTITEVNAVIGEKCSGSLFTIQDLNSLIVNVNIDESDISKVQAGQKASIVVDAANGASLEGQVISVSPVANNYTSASASSSQAGSSASSSSSKPSSSGGNSSGSSSSSVGSDVTFSAQVQIDTSDPNVKVGMSAVVNIVLDEKDDVFAVPYESIITNDKSSFVYAAVEENGKYVVKEVPVEKGMESDINVEVSGDELKEGMKVLGNPSSYQAGQTVEILDKQGKGNRGQNSRGSK